MEEPAPAQSDRTIYSKGPKIEIIIPTLNEERTLGGLVENIRSYISPIMTTILVIDGGSTDRTLDICQRENKVHNPKRERKRKRNERGCRPVRS